MAYSADYSADPRLKRPASNPPDAPDPKRPATGIRNASPAMTASNGSVARQNGVISTQAPHADMARKSKKASIVDLKMQITLQTIATMTLQIKYDQAESQQKSAEDDYQNHSAKNHFVTFPAMKETKIAAINRAKKAFKAAREPLESARRELRRLVESLVELEQSDKPPPQDAVTRAEFEELKNNTVEAAPQDAVTRAEFEELRRDLIQIRNDIGSFRNDLSSARETIDGLQANHTASQDATTKALEAVRRNIDNQATPSNTSAQADTPLLERLDTVESDVKELESEMTSVIQTVAQYVQSELQAPKDALVEIKTGVQNTSNAVATLQRNMKQTEEDTGNIREALTKGVHDQHTNAQTLQGCLDRLDKMEPLLDQAADKGALANVKDSLQALADLVDSINTAQAAQQEAANSTRPQATNGVTSDLAPFQPVLGGDDEDDVSPFHSRPAVPGTHRNFDNSDFAQMKHDIEGLKYKVQDQTNRYNNLLTDQLAQNILDNMGAVYPNLKEAERVIKSVTELQSRLGAAESMLSDIGGRTGVVAHRIDVLDNKVIATQHSSRDDVQKLRDDIALLSKKVDQHAKDVDAGRTQLREHAAAIEKNKDDLRGIETWITDRE